MKKLFAVAALAVGVFASTAYAEQPAANEYREMFKSGNFYVEYKDDYNTRFLAGENGKRMERTKYRGIPGWTYIFNPLGLLFQSDPKNPNTLYQDGKYYQFTEDDKANMLTWDKLHDENLDPKQGWNSVQMRLALPDELAVFHWWDPYRTYNPSVEAPQYKSSSKKMIKKKEYDCDLYVANAKTMAGTTYGEIHYNMLYDAGKLARIETTVVRDGKEYEINKLVIKEISSTIPEKGFKIYPDTKIYAAGTGDMNDLLEQPVQVEVLNGGVKDAQ